MVVTVNVLLVVSMSVTKIIFFRLEAYQEAYLIDKAAKVAHYQRALAEQVCYNNIFPL